MVQKWIGIFAMGASALAAGAGVSAAPPATDGYQVLIARAADWNPAAAEGQCRLRVWVDDSARVELRGDRVVLRTATGQRSFDLGSSCDQPLPFDRIDDVRVIGVSARGALLDVQLPGPRNDFTGAFTIDDPQAGGTEYEVVVAWRNPEAGVAPIAVGPAPWLDEARACQERVSDVFFERNAGSGRHLEFSSASTASLPAGFGRNRIVGEGRLHDGPDTRDMSYECVVTEDADRVLVAAYDVATRGRAY